jgi:acyl-homoserine lactone acylase PvdQ
MKFIKTPDNRQISYTRDEFGYPTIFARDREEAAFAQGFFHATDRLLQTHILLAIARGQIMEYVGDKPLYRQLDHSIRRLGLNRHTTPEIEKLTPRARAILARYCDGFNWATSQQRAPLLMRILGMPVEEMTLHLIMLVHRQFAYLGLASLQEHAEELILELAHKGMPPALFELLLGEASEGFEPHICKQVSINRPNSNPHQAAVGAGSSAWAVAASKSKNGACLLACDFHLQIGTIPPSCYVFHLEIGGDQFIQGIGPAGSPVLSTGRTNDVAWGATYANGDVFDTQLERCHNGHYEAAGQMLPLQKREELIKVRGKQSETWVFWENDFGVIDQDAMHPGVYPCVRWMGAKGGDAASLNAYLTVEEKKTAHEAAQTLSKARTASLHYVLADKNGDIAYTQAGALDQRPNNRSGAYPHVAWNDSSREVNPLADSAYPIQQNPPEGFIVSANEAVVGSHGEVLSNLPHPPYRAEQLRILLSSQSSFDKEDMMRMVYDQVDRCAINLLQAWRPLLPSEAEEILRWVDEGAPVQTQRHYQLLSRFYALHRSAARIMLVPYLGTAMAHEIVEEGEQFVIFQHHLDQALRLQKKHLVDEARLREILHRAWSESALTMDKYQMPIRATFQNFLLEGRLPKFLGFDSDEIAIPGNPHCAFQLRELQMGGLRVVVGPLFHLVFDMSERGGWYNMAGGASEKRFGPGYGKGITEWRDGKWIKLGPQ